MNVPFSLSYNTTLHFDFNCCSGAYGVTNVSSTFHFEKTQRKSGIFIGNADYRKAE